MKISGTLFAVFAIQLAAAFFLQTPKKVVVGRLQSSPFFLEQEQDIGIAMDNAITSGSLSRMSPRQSDTGSVVMSVDDLDSIWENSEAIITVQGDTLRTCSMAGSIDRVLVAMRTNGRPLNADLELWQGPQNAPQKMAVYIEDGALRSFMTVIETPRDSNAIAIRNTGMLEFPLQATIEVDVPADLGYSDSPARTIQGGALQTFPFPPAVQSVQVILNTDGRPLNARIELLQGPNNKKQVMEVYTEDGMERPLTLMLSTPGNGNVVRIVNTATIEYPMKAIVEPYLVEDTHDEIVNMRMNWDT